MTTQTHVPALDVAVGIIAAILMLSRFLNAAKPLWAMLPKTLAVLIPGIVTLVPGVIGLLAGVRTWPDLFTQLIAATAITIVGLFPKHDVPVSRP